MDSAARGLGSAKPIEMSHKINGKAVAEFAASKSHLSYLPHSGAVLAALATPWRAFASLQGDVPNSAARRDVVEEFRSSTEQRGQVVDRPLHTPPQVRRGAEVARLVGAHVEGLPGTSPVPTSASTLRTTRTASAEKSGFVCS